MGGGRGRGRGGGNNRTGGGSGRKAEPKKGAEVLGLVPQSALAGIGSLGLTSGLGAGFATAPLGQGTDLNSLLTGGIPNNMALLSALSSGDQTVTLSPLEVLQTRPAIAQVHQHNAAERKKADDLAFNARVEAEVAQRTGLPKPEPSNAEEEAAPDDPEDTMSQGQKKRAKFQQKMKEKEDTIAAQAVELAKHKSALEYIESKANDKGYSSDSGPGKLGKLVREAKQHAAKSTPERAADKIADVVITQVVNRVGRKVQFSPAKSDKSASSGSTLKERVAARKKLAETKGEKGSKKAAKQAALKADKLLKLLHELLAQATETPQVAMDQNDIDDPQATSPCKTDN